jgi:hypothetical protein
MQLRKAPAASVLGLALVTALHAQVQTTWMSTLPDFGPGAIAVDASGRHVYGGARGPERDSGIALYDAAGNLLWESTIDGAPDERVTSVAFDPQGSVVAAGHNVYYSGPVMDYDGWLRKFDAAGALSWSRVWNSGVVGGYDHMEALAVTATGEIVVVGTQATTSSGHDACVWKYDAAGNLLWLRAIDGALHANDEAEDLALGSDGSIYLCGKSNQVPGEIGSDILVAKLDGNGTVLWSELYGPGSVSARAEDIALDASDNVYVAAVVSSDVALLRFDANGSLAWVRQSSGLSAAAMQVAVDRHGRAAFLFIGHLWDQLFTRIESYDGLGNLLWTSEHPHRLGLGMFHDAGSNLFVHGRTSHTAGPGPVGSFLACYSGEGLERWVYEPPPPPIASALMVGALGPNGSLYFGDSRDGSMVALRLDPLAQAYCFGDGSDTACPCGNASAVDEREGCLNSLAVGGKLEDGGNPSLSNDTFRLHGSHMPDSSALYFQGTLAANGGAGVVFGDGLRCVAGSIRRLGIKTNVAGGSRYPEAGDPPISVVGSITTPGTRMYQCWYRNAAAFCTTSAFNLTNGLRVIWEP